ncbi:uncharacterized protein LOC126355359 [Schistocerca gregaria]|uniref:uncharacterized protein LOC126355359 n=1 Tax=Schistocerca gregaria TaxID=7010 RepID=UPI00211DB424|nr:uncharacterized protein LOC126355359 [Schistocerca gregaria]
MNRIQKLLFSEYSELEELVLLESPFAETERNGNAIRQVQLGLTPRNLIIAGDMITPADEVEIGYCLGLDPEIETLELISIVPVECVNLSVFSRRKRRTLKAHFCNSVIKYYELGGSEHRKMFWNLWCEKVRFLSPSEDFSCLSETSAESSSSESSLYIKSKKHTVSESGKHRLWCQFGRGQAKDENVAAHEEQSIVSDNHVAELLPVNRSVLRGTSLTEIRVNFEEPFQKQHSVKELEQAWVELRATTSQHSESSVASFILRLCHKEKQVRPRLVSLGKCSGDHHLTADIILQSSRSQTALLQLRKRVKKSVHHRKKTTRYVNGKFGTSYYVCDDSTLQYFKRKLKKNLKLTVWNFNSTTLAYQLTMIDRDLFCKIEEIEIEILLKQHSARNTPNIAAIIAFSHRISCLVATDILEQQNLKTRSLLIVRFISVAQRCDTLQNFQSCHSVLEGLQSPAIHRLHKTWERVRKEYPSKYCLFEKLCRKHRDPRLPAYQKAFYQASLQPPFLPFIGDILARALRRVPNFPLKLLSKSSQESFTNFNASGVQEVAAAGTRTVDTRETAHSPSRKTRYIHCIRQFFSFFHIISVASVNSIMDNKNSEVSQHELPSPRKFEANSMQVPNIQTCCLLPNNGNGEVLFKNFNPGTIPSALHPNYSVLKVGGVIHLLDWYKRGAMVYDFTLDKLARDYLLKSHYQEEKENYLLSTKLETITNSDQ